MPVAWRSCPSSSAGVRPGRAYKADVPPLSRALIGRVSGSSLTFVVVVIVALWTVHHRWAIHTLLRLRFLRDPALPQALPIQTLLPPEKKVTKTGQRATHAHQFTPRCSAQRELWAVHRGFTQTAGREPSEVTRVGAGRTLRAASRAMHGHKPRHLSGSRGQSVIASRRSAATATTVSASSKLALLAGARSQPDCRTTPDEVIRRLADQIATRLDFTGVQRALGLSGSGVVASTEAGMIEAHLQSALVPGLLVVAVVRPTPVLDFADGDVEVAAGLVTDRIEEYLHTGDGIVSGGVLRLSII